jgi:hypothetical protein
MPGFHYEAMDAAGRLITDRIDAADEADAAARLRERGYFTTRLKEISGAGQNEAKHNPEPKQHPGQSPPRWLFAFGLLFLAVGGLFLYILAVRPLWKVSQAAAWVKTSCTVMSSELKEHRSTDSDSPGSTYSIEIVYEYEFEGKTYQSGRYDFVSMASNTSMASRRAIIKAHPPGTETVCFVNPAQPSEAVLQRGWSSEMWWGLFPIPFVLIGLLGLFFGAGLFRFPAKALCEPKA